MFANAKRKTTKPKAPARVASARELARLVGRSHVSVSKWLHRDDWTFGPPPWAGSIVPRVREWMDTLATGSAGDPSTLELRKEKCRQETRKLNAQAQQAETELRRLRSSLVDADEMRQEWARMVAAVEQAMHPVPQQINSLATSHGLPAEASERFEHQVRESVAEAIRYLTRNPWGAVEHEDRIGSIFNHQPPARPAER